MKNNLSALTLADIGGRPVIGIDPGVKGAIAWIDANGMNCIKMPTEREACRSLNSLISSLSPFNPAVFIEEVFIVRGQASMKNYVTRYGTLLGAVYSNLTDIELYEVPPTQWQEHYSSLTTTQLVANRRLPRAEAAAIKKQRRAEIKQSSRSTASCLYPQFAKELQKTTADGISDAILICLYGAHYISGRI